MASKHPDDHTAEQAERIRAMGREANLAAQRAAGNLRRAAAALPAQGYGSRPRRGAEPPPRSALDSARVSRFSEPQDPAFQRLNASIGFDRRLWPYDVQQSRAHATMLAARGIIGEDDRDALLEGLDAVRQELEAGRFPFAPDDEDIHMASEERLNELDAPVGRE